ncbi:MAG: VWA domain-containing protein [Brevundimonas sp.]|uniref:TadE/TadG family type IV pilus assembly protein n=1 Tax=Brevundimonas sp. TaxID=1871086 RepID=UPI001226A70C|nr:VWA domain-containing protein [Brevundimonas sp.]RZJ17597.1 MAG: VWA domain-containing protein [Brevundimonas sp.]
MGLGLGFARRFLRARQGNVAMLFALSMPAVMMVGLGGVDVNRIYTVRAHLQDALDAATLAAARSNFTDNENITKVGLAALKANLQQVPQIEFDNEATFVLNNQGVVVGSAKVKVKTLVANIVLPPYGQVMDDKIPVASTSEVFRSNNRIEVALVLDNTGSMEGAKLTNTKKAAKDLITRLAAADARSVEEDAVRIALVPFSETVRISPGLSANDGASDSRRPAWLSNANDHTGATGSTGLFDSGEGRFTLLQRMGIGWKGCVESRAYPHSVRDTTPSSANQATMFVPQFAPDDPDRDAYNNDNAWRNYATSNNYLADGMAGSSKAFSSSSARTKAYWDRLKRVAKYGESTPNLKDDKGPNRGCSLEPVIRLTDQYSTLTSAVDRMVAVGTTNVPMGLMWGWHAVSPNLPFGDGRAYGSERLQKIIILMTDGENVNNVANNPAGSNMTGVGMAYQARYGFNASSSATQRRNAMDDKLAELCTNIRTQNIIVYSVGVQVDPRTQELLRGCATQAENYFNVTAAGDIGAAFDRIAGAIENLRISR